MPLTKFLLRSYTRGSVELISIAVILTLVVILAVTIIPGLLDTIASESVTDSQGVRKESALCAGDSCTDCVPGEPGC